MAKQHSLFVQSSSSSLAFVANSVKSQWDPTRALVWLGLNWDLITSYISITDRSMRIANFIALIDKFLLSAPYVTAQDRAAIAGIPCLCRQFWITWLVSKLAFSTRSLNPCLVRIPASLSGFIMIVFRKYFSGKTILLGLTRQLFYLIRLPF